jgi:gamma-glutamyltranspeptidase
MTDAEERRIQNLEDRVTEIAADMASLKTENSHLVKGVANFRAFQERGNRFFDRFEAKADADEKAAKDLADKKKSEVEERRSKSNMRIAIAGIIAMFILPLAIYGTGKLVSVVSETWHKLNDGYKIIQEWEQIHKSDIEKNNKSLFIDPSREYANRGDGLVQTRNGNYYTATVKGLGD